MKREHRKRTGMFIIVFFFFWILALSNLIVYAADGDEDLSDYIEIRTPEDLYKIRSNMGGKYKLMNDIDLSEVTAPGGKYDFNGCGWNPIGSNNTYSNISFEGVFDGQGYSIIGMRIYVESAEKTSYVGLFSNNSGLIKNLNMKNCNISFSSNNHNDIYCGTLAGYNSGLIENIKITDGSIYLKSFYNSLCGSNEQITVRAAGVAGVTLSRGIVRKCYNEANIKTETKGSYYSSYYKAIVDSHVSGITNGSTNTEIDECVNVGELNYQHHTSTFGGGSGGINCRSYRSGISYYGNVSNSYSICETTEYGICYDTAVNSYYTGSGKPSNNASNCYYVTGVGTAGKGWIGLNDAQMQDPDFFEEFDYENVWYMSDKTVYKYPQLQSIKNGVTSVEILSEPTNEIVVGTELKYDGAVARVYREDGTHEDIVLSPVNTIGGNTSTTGTKTVTFSYKGASAFFVIDVVPVKVNGLQIKMLPKKLDYVEGQSFEPEGLVVNAIYNNGTVEQCNEYYIEDVDTSPGEKDVVISYNSTQTSFKINYIPKVIENIEVTKVPDKIIYDEGEEFEKSGMIVTAEFNDGSTEEVSDYITGELDGTGYIDVAVTYKGHATSTKVYVNKLVKKINFENSRMNLYEGSILQLNINIDPIDADDKEIEWISSDISIATVNANGEVSAIKEGKVVIEAYLKKNNKISAKCYLNIQKVKPQKLVISQMPQICDYLQGEVFDRTGLKVNLVYNNGTEEEIKDYELISPIPLTGARLVTVIYGNMKQTFTVYYHTKVLNGLKVTKNPTKTEYYDCEEFDKSGMEVTAVYDEGIERNITNYSISEIKGLGAQKLIISYAGKTTFIDVTVKESGGINDLSNILQSGNITDQGTGYSINISKTSDGYEFYYEESDKYNSGYLKWIIDDNLNGKQIFTIKIPTSYTNAALYSYEANVMSADYYPGEYVTYNALRESVGKNRNNLEINRLGSLMSANAAKRIKDLLMNKYNLSLKKCGFASIDKEGDYNFIDEEEVKETDKLIAFLKNGSRESDPQYPSLSWKVSYDTSGIIKFENTNYSVNSKNGIILKTYSVITCDVEKKDHKASYSYKVSFDSFNYLYDASFNMALVNTDEKYVKVNFISTDNPIGKYDTKFINELRDTESEGLSSRISIFIMSFYDNYGIDLTKCGFNSMSLGYRAPEYANHSHVKEIDTAVEPNCTSEGLTEGSHCAECGEILEKQNVVSAVGHDWAGEEIIKAATCTEDGEMCHICLKCGKMQNTSIKSQGHTLVLSDSIEATCTEDGYTSECYCSVCGKVFGDKQTISAHHSYGDWQVDEENENMFYRECLKCGFIEESEHRWDNGEIIIDATCIEEGEILYKCLDCEESYSEIIPSKGHSYVLNERADSTCTEKGLSYGCYCDACGTIFVEQEEMDATGHIWDEGYVSRKPKIGIAGEETYTCIKCHEKRTEDIPELSVESTDLVFIDVREAKKYYYTPVYWAYFDGITKGTSATTFSPDNPCTRAQFVTFLWRLAGEPKAKTKTQFNDVQNENAFYYKAVMWAAENGITTGTGNGKFSPDDPCTRAQCVTFIYRAAGKPEITDDMHSQYNFTDVTNKDFSYDPVTWAASNNITTGVGNNRFAPSDKCTRGQLVTFLYRFANTEP